jgi:hypothetical protein
MCLAAPLEMGAAELVRMSGGIGGVVRDAAGVPQLGAAVTLFNRQDRAFEKAFTDERGEFAFAGLFPDIYSIRVSLANFVPAVKNSILVQPGSRSMLHVSLTNLFSSIQLVYPPVDSKTLMTDEWKWVLRGASATRPVLRFAPEFSEDPLPSRHGAVFSDTRGMLKVSAGDRAASSGVGQEADLGTAFALATSLFGNNTLQVAGNVGYGAQTGVPSAGFRTTLGRPTDHGSPEISVTMRQLFLPGRATAALGGAETGLPMLRTMSLSFDDRTRLSDRLSMQYGFSLDSVSFLDRLNYFSPYARLVYTVESDQVDFAYTSGNARPALGAERGPDAELQSDIASLAMFPRISVKSAHARVQRGENFEAGYTRTFGSRAARISAWRESVGNTALTLAGAGGLYTSGDILPDLFSGSSIFNAGGYQTLGYTASFTQNVGDRLSTTLLYGSIGTLTADDHELVSQNPDELRRMIHAGRRHAATLRTAATSPWTGTHLIASYQWTDNRRAIPGRIYSTQSSRPEPGLNVYLRQPIPALSGLPWRMEATADLRNLLAQGYLPIDTSFGGRLLLVQTPRSFRGGLSFIF